MTEKPAKRPRGRPQFKPTPAQRRQVSVARGGGMSLDEIALALGIAVDTLQKHFDHELSVGAAQRRLEVLNAMQAAARKGNVSAAKAYMALDPRLVPPTDPVPGPHPQPTAADPLPDARPKPGVPLGKKEQAAAAAVTAQVGTEWEGLLPGTPTVQ